MMILELIAFFYYGYIKLFPLEKYKRFIYNSLDYAHVGIGILLFIPFYYFQILIFRDILHTEWFIDSMTFFIPYLIAGIFVYFKYISNGRDRRFIEEYRYISEARKSRIKYTFYTLCLADILILLLIYLRK